MKIAQHRTAAQQQQAAPATPAATSTAINTRKVKRLKKNGRSLMNHLTAAASLQQQ